MGNSHKIMSSSKNPSSSHSGYFFGLLTNNIHTRVPSLAATNDGYGHTARTKRFSLLLCRRGGKKNTHLKALAHADMANTLSAACEGNARAAPPHIANQWPCRPLSASRERRSRSAIWTAVWLRRGPRRANFLLVAASYVCAFPRRTAEQLRISKFRRLPALNRTNS